MIAQIWDILECIALTCLQAKIGYCTLLKLTMATNKAQLAFYSWTQVYDWIAETQNSWNFRSFSSFLNTVLMLWILLERHKLLDSTLSKLATLEGYTSVKDLRESLGDRFGQTTISNNDTTAKGLSD